MTIEHHALVSTNIEQCDLSRWCCFLHPRAEYSISPAEGAYVFGAHKALCRACVACGSVQRERRVLPLRSPLFAVRVSAVRLRRKRKAVAKLCRPTVLRELDEKPLLALLVSARTHEHADPSNVSDMAMSVLALWCVCAGGVPPRLARALLTDLVLLRALLHRAVVMAGGTLLDGQTTMKSAASRLSIAGYLLDALLSCPSVVTPRVTRCFFQRPMRTPSCMVIPRAFLQPLGPRTKHE